MSTDTGNGNSNGHLRNRKMRLAMFGIVALLAGYVFAAYTKADSSLFVTYATGVCGLCGFSVWGNVREHEAKRPIAGKPSDA